MSQPNTGVSFKAAGHAYLNALLARRGPRWSLAVRDWNGSATNISPGSAFGAPMSLDGKWRDDMYAIVKNAAGRWVYNPNPNLGFLPVGYVLPEGIERATKIDSDPLEGLQTLDPVRVDPQKRDRTLMFTAMEQSPVVDALEFNLPLSGILERAAADGTYFAGESTDDDPIRRQCILMHEDRMGGQSVLTAFPFPKCVLTDLGSRKGNKKDAEAAKFTLSREIDNWFVNEDGLPLLDGRWSTGTLWDDNTMPGLTFLASPPVAAALTATTASLVFGTPIGGLSPYTYDVEKSPNGTSSWTAATSTEAVSDGVVTSSISSLTTATGYYFRAKVTDDDDNTTYSAVSNLITTP